MKYTEEEFKKEVEILYNKDFEVVSRFKGLTQPILIKDKYGVIEIKKANQILKNRPGLKSALNKTEYFMNMLKEQCPDIYPLISPASEYIGMNNNMLFDTEYGIISITPGNLISKNIKPSIKSAINRKEYFKNQLKAIYGDRYDFIIENTNRHGGKSILICPEHGEVLIDNDYIFMGKGCPKCKNWRASDCFYLIKLFNNEESFYKLGISHRNNKGEIRRYKDYRLLNYKIEVIKEIDFEDPLECRQFELKLKRIIKNDLYTPKNWDNETSTECFNTDLLDLILKQL